MWSGRKPLIFIFFRHFVCFNTLTLHNWLYIVIACWTDFFVLNTISAIVVVMLTLVADHIVWSYHDELHLFQSPGFADTCIKHSDYYMVGGIFSGLKDTDPQTLTQNAPTDKTCYIYRSNEEASTFICLCNVEVAVEQCFAWVNQVQGKRLWYDTW